MKPASHISRRLAAASLWLLLSAPALAQQASEAAHGSADPMQEHYQLGHGLKLGESGFTLGGYGELSARNPEDDDVSLAVDSLSAILWWDGGGRVHFFSEVELDEGLQLESGESVTQDSQLVLERAYLDLAWRDELKFRIGKFLTPVGRWNLIHAAPLTWTTSRPLITEATFPTNASGAMVYGVLPFTSEGLEYSVYTSVGEEIFPRPGLDTFREAVGGRLAATLLPHTQFGLSYVSFEQESSPDERKELVGADFAWTWRRYELSGEYAYRSIARSDDTRDEQGHYVQLVAPLVGNLYGVARYEGFRRSGEPRDLHIYLAGLTWRLSHAMVLKAEYNHATDNESGVPDGALASFAVLF